MANNSWWWSLEQFNGQEVECSGTKGRFVFQQSNEKGVPDWKISTDAQELLTGSTFERAAGCRQKNPKKSICFTDSGLSLEQAAAQGSLSAGQLEAMNAKLAAGKKKTTPRPDVKEGRTKVKSEGARNEKPERSKKRKQQDELPAEQKKHRRNTEDDDNNGVCLDIDTKPTLITVDKDKATSVRGMKPQRRVASCDRGYRTVKATHPVKSGCYCFEITVDTPRTVKLKDPSITVEPHVRVGWCTNKFKLEAPVGFDRHGFAYRDTSTKVKDGVEGGGSAFHRARGRAYGEGYGPGDTISCYICLPDLDETGGVPEVSNEELHPEGKCAECKDIGQLSREEAQLETHPGSYLEFVKNGVSQGKAFVDIPQGNYYPCVALYMGATVTFNFGDPAHGGFKYPQPPELQSFKKMSELQPIIVSEPAAAPAPAEGGAESAVPHSPKEI